MEKKIKVLYIDDETNNLTGFKATFRFDYTVLVAETTAKAKEHLKEHNDIRIILCDQRMPDQTGVQFFEEIRSEYPDPIRMLITGYTDIESVIDAINRGNIFRYIKKPWTDTDVQSAIEEGNKFFLANNMLATKNKELQSAYDELGKFAYSVTHDMRGPLLSVSGAIQIAQNCQDVGEIKEILTMMDAAVNKLDEFITNMHEYYNLKRGQLVFEQIDFKQLLSDTEALFRLSGNIEHIRFTSNVKQDAPFWSDQVSIKIVLTNLLSNAFKYQRKTNTDKFVDVDIEVNNGVATIFVKDNGIGIHQDHINNVFDMFYRATSEESGSGFGLFNVKDALHRVDGQIGVTSVVNEGTTFKVTIPGKPHGSK